MIDYDEDPEFKPFEYGYYWYKQKLLDWDHEPHWARLAAINRGNFRHAKFPDWTVIKIYKAHIEICNDAYDAFAEEYYGANEPKYLEVEIWQARALDDGETIPNNRIRQLAQMGQFIKIEEPK